MPRSAAEIIAHADQLARQFEDGPAPDSMRDAASLRAIADAFASLAASERALATAVDAARAQDHSWAAIGAMLGTSGEAARQRYGTSRHGKRIA
jgi:hypothetical protein